MEIIDLPNAGSVPGPTYAEPVLPVFYDVARAPLTFDAAVYLATACGTAQAAGFPTVDLTIVANSFRNLSIREKAYDLATRQWRLLNIVHRLATLLPAVRSVILHRAGTLSLPEVRFPPYYDPRKPDKLPYSSLNLIHVFKNGGNVQPFRPSAYAAAWAETQFRARERAIVLSVRRSDFNHQRDASLDDWYELHRFLVAAGYEVLVIPDQADALQGGPIYGYDWRVCTPAALDLDLRLALYKHCHANLAWTGGHTSLMWLSRSRFRIFGCYHSENFLSNTDYFKEHGLEVGVQPPWFEPGQEYDWLDSKDVTRDYLIAESARYLERMRALSA